MVRYKKSLNVSLSESDKNYIQEKSKKLGFATVSAFLVDASKTYFRVNVDMTYFRNLTREINYIGKNINGIVRRIYTDKFFTDSDIKSLEFNQKKIIELLQKKQQELIELERTFTSESLKNVDLESIKKAYVQNDLQIPKKVLLQNTIDQMKDDVYYLFEIIQSSSQENELADFFVAKVSDNIDQMISENYLTLFADDLYIFTEKMKLKLLNLNNDFSEDDWDELYDIMKNYSFV